MLKEIGFDSELTFKFSNYFLLDKANPGNKFFIHVSYHKF